MKCIKCKRELNTSNFRYVSKDKYTKTCKGCLNNIKHSRKFWDNKKHLPKEPVKEFIERDRDIISLIKEGILLSDIGRLYGISRQRVFQIYNSIGYVYLLKCGEFYKIGVSNRTANRIKNLDVGNPYPITIEMSQKVINNRQVERNLHEKFKNRKIKGEWFKLDKKDIDLVKEMLSRG